MKISLLMAVIFITGCESLYWKDGMREGQLISVLVLNQEGIAEKCDGAKACAYVTELNCIVYLPEYATSELILHEMSHCTGREDPPTINRDGR